MLCAGLHNGMISINTTGTLVSRWYARIDNNMAEGVGFKNDALSSCLWYLLFSSTVVAVWNGAVFACVVVDR